MDYQLILDFSKLLIAQFVLLGGMLLFARKRTGIEETYQKALRDYRKTGILSYLELKKLFSKYSNRTVLKLVEVKAIRGELERSLCTHIYKCLKLHQRDLNNLKKYPFLKSRMINRIASMNLKENDFEKPSKQLKEMIAFKDHILNSSVSIDNTLVALNTYGKKSYVPIVLKQIDRDQLSLLIFSFEKIKSQNLKLAFAKIAFDKVPSLKNYLIETMKDSLNPVLKSAGYHYQGRLLIDNFRTKIAV